jgi:CheY-like chemotaxis protein
MEDVEFSKLREPIALVVDDEPLILMDTADMIADEGFSVVEASSADEAFAFLAKRSTPRFSSYSPTFKRREI